MQTVIEPQETPAVTAFDAAPHGLPLLQPAANTVGVRWTEPRKIRRVILELPPGTALPSRQSLRLEYWHCTWNGGPDRVFTETNAGSVGWDATDDWTNGTWKVAAVQASVEQSDTNGPRVVFTFEATSATEFPDLETAGVAYRRTLQVRVVAEAPLPAGTRLAALTDAVAQPLRVRIEFGRPAIGEAAAQALAGAGPETGQIEVYNGAVAAVHAGSLGVQVVDGTWTLASGAGGSSGEGVVTADLSIAVDLLNPLYDRPIVTLRSSTRPLSFAADEVARGDRILVDDLGVLITRADDPTTLEGHRAALKELGHKTIYARVADEPEQTLMRAWRDMPPKRPLYFVHGLPGNRNAIRQHADGSVLISANPRWFGTPDSPRDTQRKLWKGDHLSLHFGFPEESGPGGPVWGGRALRDGWLPELRTWWQDGPIHYEQTAVLDTLAGDLGHVPLDEPTVLLMRVRALNTSATAAATATLRLTAKVQDATERLGVEGDRVRGDSDGQPRVRYLVRTLDDAGARDAVGGAALVQDGDALRWSHDLRPGMSRTLEFRIPTITLTSEEELAALQAIDIDERTERICQSWRELTARSTQIRTPEPWLNDFYQAHVRHLLVNCVRELGSDRLHAHVGTYHYGDFPNESAMMISDLDRRGYADEARRCIDMFLHYQGTVALPGDYSDQTGVLYGAGGHEMGGYNKSHGYLLWLAAEHWRMTRDAAWMEQSAPRLIAACEWIVRQRARTMAPGDPRPIEYGFLPAGSLEDVMDYWHWLATNAATTWGFSAVADALADAGEPRGGELQAQAAAYRADLLRGWKESRIRSAVVRLRDGTYVPKFPSRLYERGRALGWIRETLEGSVFLPAFQLIPPTARETKWILEDYEDNLYISDAYGYSIPAFDKFWFSRGGFSMQANLLDGPLPYLWRDEIKHYLRAFFNGFASAYYPDICMCNEHCLPELGVPAGDHFKSSDEAQVAYWLRLMFVREDLSAPGGALLLGQALPRYWLADGQRIGIERAATYFGPLSFEVKSNAAKGEIRARVTPPTRNRPARIYVRLRHPDAQRMQAVTVNGAAWAEFDAAKEWVILPGTVEGAQEIAVRYNE